MHMDLISLGEGIEDITEYEKELEAKHTPVEPIDITKKCVLFLFLSDR